MAVVGYHYFPGWIKGGFVGVDIFFVISGYLISGILIDSLNNNKFSIVDFYSRRVRRILPALILVMLFVLVFGWFALLPDEYAQLGKHIAGGSAFISNFILYFESGYWDTASNYKPLLHLWSLGVEEQFYIIFPVILFVLHKLGLRKSLFIALLFIVSFALNLYYYKADMTLDFYMPFTRFWELMAGSLVAFGQRNTNTLASTDHTIYKNILSFVGALMLLYSVFLITDKNFPGYKALIPVIGAVLFVCAGSNSLLNRYLFSLKPIVFVGLISYPLYLWHWSLISGARIFCLNYGILDLSRSHRVGLIMLAIVLAILTYHFIERPIRFSKNSRGAKTIALVCVLIALGLSGFAVYTKQGITDRGAVKTIGENNQAVIDELRHIHNIDNACASKYSLKLLQFCYLREVGDANTIVLIGDSHTQMAYTSIAAYNAKRGINTIAFSNPFMTNNPEAALLREKVLSVITTDDKINKVFLIASSLVRLYGKDEMGIDGFRNMLQLFADRLSEKNIAMYIVEDNPSLYAPYYRNYRENISLNSPDYRYVTRDEMLERHKEYREIIASIKGATVIYTIDAFCPIDKCLLADENDLPLFRDEGHLTANAGGNFLINHALKPYLDE
ncbi:acyltransferase [Campylobacterota bacterium]|nr:acyltransferase [Campylobacterota bacterium]